MRTETRRGLTLPARIAVLASASLLTSSTAIATVLHVETRVSCQTRADPGTLLDVEVHLKNEECVPVGARIFSTVVGNSDQVMNELGIFGPELVGELSVPAARDRTPGYCDPTTNRCGGWGGASNLFCRTSADCFCRLSTPTVLDVSLSATPVLPSALANTVVTQLITVEWGGGIKTQIERCLVEIAAEELPEPASSVQLVAGVLGLLALSRLRANRARPRRFHRVSPGPRDPTGGTNMLKENHP